MQQFVDKLDTRKSIHCFDVIYDERKFTMLDLAFFLAFCLTLVALMALTFQNDTVVKCRPHVYHL